MISAQRLLRDAEQIELASCGEVCSRAPAHLAFFPTRVVLLAGAPHRLLDSSGARLPTGSLLQALRSAEDHEMRDAAGCSEEVEAVQKDGQPAARRRLDGAAAVLLRPPDDVLHRILR